MNRCAPPWLLAIFASLPCAALAWLLAGEWELNPHYSFGWLMPGLTAFLMWKRWQDRPHPSALPASRLPLLLLAGAALAWPLVLIVHQANPDWRLVFWVAAVLAMTSGVAILHLLGGWPWCRHFAFPLFFFLLAVPWPSELETAIVTTLMRWVAAACVEALNWLGHPALQQGNLIKLPQGTIGVDEACSGIRSLQANLMAALFVGELYRRSIFARALLVLGGLLLSLGLNLARALALALLWVHHGNPAMDTWHDPAGHLILLISFLLLIAVGRKPGRNLPSVQDRPPRPVPAIICGTAILAILVGPLLTEAWFIGRGGPMRVTSAPWQLRLPSGPEVKSPSLPASVPAMLRYDRGDHRLWFPDDGSVWSLFYFEWEPTRNSARLARAHSPEVCLPAAGADLEAKGLLWVPVPTCPPLRFEQFEARIGPQVLHVFYLRWQDDPDSVPLAHSVFDRRERLRMAWLGRREQRQRVIQLMTEGYPDLDSARAAVLRWFSENLRLAAKQPASQPSS